MDKPFYMTGNKMCVYRYKAHDAEKQEERYFGLKRDAEDYAEQVNGTVTPLDTTEYEWMDGIVIEGPTTNPMIQALEIYHMGREAWEAKQNAPSTEARMAQMESAVAIIENAMCENEEDLDSRLAEIENALCELDERG